MPSSTDDDKRVTKANSAPDGEMKQRLDASIRASTRHAPRYVPGDRSSLESIVEALREEGMLEPERALPNIRVFSDPRAESLLEDMQWFAVQTAPQGEEKATTALAERHLASCAPSIANWAVAHRKDVVRVRPLFPRYVFVGLVPDRNGDIDFRTPRLCDGVAGFVRGAGDIMQVEDTAIGDVMLADQRQWADFIWSKAAEERPTRKQYRTDGFVHSMTDILEADPVTRMKLFMERFGRRRQDLRKKAS